MAWTKEKVELLKELWTKGLSASQIATQMQDVTRNAVIGKVHRLGLSWRSEPTKPARKIKVKKSETAKISDKSEDVASNDFFKSSLQLNSNKKLLGITDLDVSMCKWPIGNPTSKDFHFCGKPASRGKSYCSEHMENAIYKPRKKDTEEVDNVETMLKKA